MYAHARHELQWPIAQCCRQHLGENYAKLPHRQQQGLVNALFDLGTRCIHKYDQELGF